MVVVDYSIHDRSCIKDEDDDQRRQPFPDKDDSLDVALANFCPRLREAVTLLSRHKVGPLQKHVHLSDFQSSSSSSLSGDGLSSNTQSTHNDRFVLALPYMYDDIYALCGHNYMVQWSIISLCSCPDKAPDVILLGMDDTSMVSGFREVATIRQSLYSNLRSLNTQRCTLQTQECYWQQYVASDAFHVQSLSKWDKINNDKSSSLMQYCRLADQLYECYGHFQLYKLKMSLKSMPSMVQPPPQLIQAYTQYKQLIKLSKSSMAKVDTTTPEISVELFVDLDNDIVIKDCDDRHNQTQSAFICICAIISLGTYEPTASALPLTIKTTGHLSDGKTTYLASVTATFPPTVISHGTCNTNTSTSSNANASLNNKYSVRILNPKLSYKESMMSLMLDTITEQPFETTIIDFVTYVHRVQHVAFQAYTHEISSEEDRLSSIDDDNNPVKLLLQSLFGIFCDSPFNGNSLLDYQINDQDPTIKMTTNVIRFLLVDGDLATETSQLKYILIIEFSKEVCKEFENITITEESIQSKNLVPVVTLRSVYDDENSEHFLNIDVDNILTEADNQKYSDKLASIIKTAAVNGMQKLRHEAVTLVLTRYNKKWSSTDSYFMNSSAKPLSYPLT